MIRRPSRPTLFPFTMLLRSVGLYRSLVAEHPISYAPDLAFELGRLGNSLLDLNRHAESLNVHQESVGLYRSLVTHNPESYTPVLAFHLLILGNNLSNFNRHT